MPGEVRAPSEGDSCTYTLEETARVLETPLPSGALRLLDERLSPCLPLGILLEASDLLQGHLWNYAGRVKSVPHSTRPFSLKDIEYVKDSTAEEALCGVLPLPSSEDMLCGVVPLRSCLQVLVLCP